MKIHPKVEVGQEWHYTGWQPNLSLIVSKIYGGCGYYKNAKSIGDVQFIYLEINGHVNQPQLWTYLGTPVPCNECNEFCRQQCGKKFKCTIHTV